MSFKNCSAAAGGGTAVWQMMGENPGTFMGCNGNIMVSQTWKISWEIMVSQTWRNSWDFDDIFMDTFPLNCHRTAVSLSERVNGGLRCQPQASSWPALSAILSRVVASTCRTAEPRLWADFYGFFGELPKKI